MCLIPKCRHLLVPPRRRGVSPNPHGCLLCSTPEFGSRDAALQGDTAGRPACTLCLRVQSLNIGSLILPQSLFLIPLNCVPVSGCSAQHQRAYQGENQAPRAKGCSVIMVCSSEELKSSCVSCSWASCPLPSPCSQLRHMHFWGVLLFIRNSFVL